jgi:alkanesulfonate monooxygenase SsuD/methylene tetrahydromethanopterin reductase-like flavin-dependent oxidoreductase (luciferase family)
MEPKPFQKPHPPVWFGGSHPDALRRAVRLADGFMGAGSTTTEDFIAQAGVVREALAEQGRDPAAFRVAKRVYVGVGDDPDRARRRTGDALSELYGYFGMKGIERVGVAGRPGDVAAELARIAAAGADLILLNPLSGEAEQMERLAAEVIPQLA